MLYKHISSSIYIWYIYHHGQLLKKKAKSQKTRHNQNFAWSFIARPSAKWITLQALSSLMESWLLQIPQITEWKVVLPWAPKFGKGISAWCPFKGWEATLLYASYALNSFPQRNKGPNATECLRVLCNTIWDMCVCVFKSSPFTLHFAIPGFSSFWG